MPLVRVKSKPACIQARVKFPRTTPNGIRPTTNTMTWIASFKDRLRVVNSVVHLERMGACAGPDDCAAPGGLRPARPKGSLEY